MMPVMPRLQPNSSPKLGYSLAAAALLLALGAALPAKAETAAEKGLEIARETENRDSGFGDSQVKLTMTLSNRNGDTSTRQLRIKTLETNDAKLGDRSVTVFDQPRDIKGTAFLSHTKVLLPDDQWLYLPALKRVKRISSANKSGSFVGSEFSYEDLVSFEVEKYSYIWLRDEKCGALDCFVSERFPLYKNSGYTKQVVWIDKEHYRVQKIDFFDRRDALRKTMVPSEYQQYLGKYWRAQRIEMNNHQTGKKTVLVFEDFAFQTGVVARDFTASRLKTVR